MTKHEAYLTWAPPDSIWSPWAKPVCFAHMGDGPAEDAAAIGAPVMNDVPPVTERIAIIVDLPGPAGVSEALGIATRGYRPVPLYNAAPARNEVVNVSAIVWTLQAAATALAGVRLPPDAP